LLGAMLRADDLYRPIARIEAFPHERNENFVLVLAAMKKSADMAAVVQSRPRHTNRLAAISHYAAKQVFLLMLTVN